MMNDDTRNEKVTKTKKVGSTFVVKIQSNIMNYLTQQRVPCSFNNSSSLAPSPALSACAAAPSGLPSLQVWGSPSPLPPLRPSSSLPARSSNPGPVLLQLLLLTPSVLRESGAERTTKQNNSICAGKKPSYFIYTYIWRMRRTPLVRPPEMSPKTPLVPPPWFGLGLITCGG